MKRAARLVFFLLVLAFGLFFGLLNAEPVHIDYYFGSRDLPLSLVLVLMLVIGALCGVLAGLGQYLRLRREIHRLRKDIRAAERDTARSRALAAKDAP
jgi:putative membrane protein